MANRNPATNEEELIVQPILVPTPSQPTLLPAEIEESSERRGLDPELLRLGRIVRMFEALHDANARCRAMVYLASRYAPSMVENKSAH